MPKEDDSEVWWLRWAPGTSLAHPQSSPLQKPTIPHLVKASSEIFLLKQVLLQNTLLSSANSQHKEENLMGYIIRYVHKKKLNAQENHTFSWN